MKYLKVFEDLNDKFPVDFSEFREQITDYLKKVGIKYTIYTYIEYKDRIDIKIGNGDKCIIILTDRNGSNLNSVYFEFIDNSYSTYSYNMDEFISILAKLYNIDIGNIMKQINEDTYEEKRKYFSENSTLFVGQIENYLHKVGIPFRKRISPSGKYNTYIITIKKTNSEYVFLVGEFNKRHSVYFQYDDNLDGNEIDPKYVYTMYDFINKLSIVCGVNIGNIMKQINESDQKRYTSSWGEKFNTKVEMEMGGAARNVEYVFNELKIPINKIKIGTGFYYPCEISGNRYSVSVVPTSNNRTYTTFNCVKSGSRIEIKDSNYRKILKELILKSVDISPWMKKINEDVKGNEFPIDIDELVGIINK